MNRSIHPSLFHIISCSCPAAYAVISGNADNPQLHGKAYFYNTNFGGTLVEVEITGLPDIEKQYQSSFYGMHIHENGDCTLPFDKTGNHYNPCNLPHPFHAGDMPPLLGSCGYAYTIFFSGRFQVNEIIGRSLIIHGSPDDFTTQPSGNSGTKIGCGVIYKSGSFF